MTAGAGPARRRRRLMARPLIVALVALAALVSPLEAGLLPGPASDAVGGSAALAQTPSTKVVAADPCPTTSYWYDQANPFGYEPDPADASLCVLEVPACPESPLEAGRLMKLSMPSDDVLSEFPDAAHAPVAGYDRYPEFCEDRVESTSSDYGDCQALTGYAVIDDGSVCRAFHPIGCVAGLHQHGSQTCRAVQRRSWTCDGAYQPGNRFRVCYLPTAHPAGTPVPACATGAPDFGVFADAEGACEAYVGEDVLRDGSERSCSDYTTGPFPAALMLRSSQIGLSTNTANDHWCQFDGAWLNPACHAQGASCASQPSLCLKRASRTGGCDLIIETIRCRGYQHAFEHNRVGADEVRQAGCTPCVTLPFETPACDDDTAAPSNHDAGAYWAQRAILRCGFDFSYGSNPWLTASLDPLARTVADCPQESRSPTTLCADPPSGSVEWSSNHASGLAVVNSAVILRIADLPFGYETFTFLSYNPKPSSVQNAIGVTSRRRLAPKYRDSDQLDRVPRYFTNIDSSRAYQNLHEMAASECLFFEWPLFSIMIEELWPDTQAARDEIERLFGGDSLQWWTNLPEDEQMRRTEARGLTWQTHDGARDTTLRSVAECHEHTLSCVWQPQHPGYYRIVGAGGWPLFMNQDSRRWGQGRFEQQNSRFTHYSMALEEYLDTNTGPGPGELTTRLRTFSNAVGIDESDAFDYAGMEGGSPPKMRAPEHETDYGADDWLFSEHARGLTGCPWPTDLRVICSGGGLAGNYTETAPVGIIVHEVRTQTVAPVQNR